FLEWAVRFQAYEVNGYTYTAKGSVNPIKHGPSEAAAFYGHRYWSHAEFPTWIEVDLPKIHSVKGLWIDGNGLKATPRDFSVDAFINGQWKTMAEVQENADTRQILYWQEPVETQKLRLNIYRDNGNKNTALQAV